MSSQTAGRPSGVSTPRPSSTSFDDRRRDDVARAERVGELLAVGVQQHGAVGARGLGNRVALQVLRPRAAVRVVLEGVEIARLRPERDRDLGHLARGARMVRGELAALLGDPEAAASGGEDDRSRVDDHRLSVVLERRAPAGGRPLERAQGVVRELGSAARLERLAQALRDRVARAVADLQEAPTGRASAARQAVAAVCPSACTFWAREIARELDAELLEPVDRGRRLGGEHLDEAAVGGLVRALPDVLGVQLGRVVGAERGLDPSLRLRGVARLERALRGETDPRPCPLGRERGGEARGPGADHEHVEDAGAWRHEPDRSVFPNPLH